ncbi:hypothetical protein CJ483_09350 [Bacillus sp. PK3_68]|nr:hypothetical protein CJ483_09350 [Bacillus sp. PK3_68]
MFYIIKVNGREKILAAVFIKKRGKECIKGAVRVGIRTAAVHIILSDERTATGQVNCSCIYHILIENECQL